MQAEAQLNASENTAKDSLPPDFTKEIKSSKAAATPDYSSQAEMRRKWSIETAACRLVHARKF